VNEESKYNNFSGRIGRRLKADLLYYYIEVPSGVLEVKLK